MGHGRRPEFPMPIHPQIRKIMIYHEVDRETAIELYGEGVRVIIKRGKRIHKNQTTLD